MSNILITSAGRRVSLVKAFQTEITSLLVGGRVFTADMKPELSAACQISDGSFKVPHSKDPDYCKAILDICRGNNISLVIPTIDTELIAFSDNIDYFREYSIDLVISHPEMVRMCRDKRKTHSFFDKTGLNRPLDIDREKPVFPLFAKPFDGSSSIGSRAIMNREGLTESVLADNSIMLIEYLDPADHVEYTVDMYFDRNSELKCAVPRERLEVRGGEISKGITRKGPVYDMVLERFRKCEGFRGCVTFQIFRNTTTGKMTAIEINPRFGGGYPLAYRANANFPAMLINEYIMKLDIPFCDGWTEGLLMLRYDDEVLVHDYKG